MKRPPLRKINAKVFLGLMVGAAALAGLIFVVHYFQYKRIAAALLWQARRAEEQGQTERMVRYLQRYLEFMPRDLEENARLGQTLAGEYFAGQPRLRQRALFVLDNVLTRDPNRPELRKQLIRVALELNRLKVARDHLEVLYRDARAAGSATPAGELGELEASWGQLFEAEEKPGEALTWYRLAVKHAPTEQDAYVRLAYLLRRQRDADPQQVARNAREADQVIEDLVARNKLAHQSYLARWLYRREFDLVRANGSSEPNKVPLDRAAQDVMSEALKRAPESVEVLLAAADVQRLLGQEAVLQGKPGGAALTPVQAEERARPFRKEAYKYLQRGLELQAKKGPRAAADKSQFELLWQLANLLLDDPAPGPGADTPEARTEVEQVIAQVRKTQAAPVAADYLQGRLLLRGSRWAEAATLFERARPSLAKQPDLSGQLDLFLAQCYEHLEEPRQWYAACERVVNWKQDAVAARMGMGAAQWAMGNLDEALKNYRLALDRPGAPPRGWLEVARLEIQKQYLATERHWKGAEEALDRALQAPQETEVEVAILRAEILAAQNKMRMAEELLVHTRESHPDRVELWTGLANLVRRQKDGKARALQVLAEAQEKLKDRVELRLTRAFFVSEDTGLSADEKKARLASFRPGRDSFKGEDRARLLSGLAGAYFRAGLAVEARELLEELARQPGHESDLRLRLLLFDLALREGDEGRQEQTLADIRALEGDAGALYPYGQALRLIWLVEQDRRDRAKTLHEARLVLDRVLNLRPSWPPVFLARARIESLNDNPEQAITNIKQAIELGETNPRVIQQLVDALIKRQRFAEAEEEINRLRQTLLVNAALSKQAADVAAHKGDYLKAVELARDAVQENSKDFRDLVWKGRLLAEAGSFDEAEAKLRRALELAPGEPEPLIALVQFLAARGRRPDAEALLREKAGGLPKAKSALTLAQCCEALGNTPQALAHYQQALKEQPDDPALVRAVAGFHLRAGRLREAEPLLTLLAERKLPNLTDNEVTWARRSLAMVLSAANDYNQFRRALDLVGLKLDEKGQLVREERDRQETADSLRAKARVLATQGQKQFRERAIQLLEELNRNQALTPDDRFVLALLYDNAGAWGKAREKLHELVLTETKTPQYLAQFIQGLIREGEFAPAATWIERLEALEKQRNLPAGAYATVELKARLLEAQGQGEQALSLLRAHTRRPGANPQELLQVIASLGRQKKFTEALAECERAWQLVAEKKFPPESAGGVCVAVLRSMQPTDEQCLRVENWLKASIRDNPGNTALEMHLADLYDQRGRYPEAEALYWEILKKEDGNVVALNNLAWLLAQRLGEGQKAIPLIEKAITGMGRRPDLLDTRGLVYLSLNHTDEALADLKEAASDAPTAARMFHLARAYFQARDRNNAAKVLRQAKELGLQPEKLHPVEQQSCRQLLAELKLP